MEINGTKVSMVFTIKAVESIPCDLRSQQLSFDSTGNLISEPIKTPWPMPWVTEEITKYAAGTHKLPAEDKFKIYNPEESDQYVFVQVEKY